VFLNLILGICVKSTMIDCTTGTWKKKKRKEETSIAKGSVWGDISHKSVKTLVFPTPTGDMS
jgi:hypothetical protein